MMLYVILHISLVYILATKATDDPDILFNRVDEYNWIYSDSGTGANVDVSIWRPVDYQNGFCALGDVAHASHDKPTTSSITVKGLLSGAVTNPTSFTEVWNDRGSGGQHDVRIMSMNAPSGYTCVGHVAILGYSSQPDRSKYCCVKDGYVVQADLNQVWNDAGSGADDDVSLWKVLKVNGVYGVDANNFLSIRSHSYPTETPYLLMENDDVMNAMNWISVDVKPIQLYEITDMDLIWKDSGSGADDDLSIWRARVPDDYYSLGDTAVGSHSQPQLAFMARSEVDGVFRAPVGWTEVWNDRGSGASSDVTIYSPVCPSGYRALGHVSISRYNTDPSSRDIRCVDAQYTVQGTWTKIWDDSGSGADDDVTVWQANANQAQTQGVRAMSAVRRHGDMRTNAYVLDASFVNYYRENPVERYRLQNVVYDLNAMQMLDQTPETLGITTVTNNNDVTQTVTRVMAFSYTESYSWSNSVGLQYGVSTTVTAGVPNVASASTTVSTTLSYDYTWGGKYDETKTDEIRVEINIPARSQVEVTIAAWRYKADLPYTATLVAEFYNGNRATYTIESIYRGVNVNEVFVEYGAFTPILT